MKLDALKKEEKLVCIYTVYNTENCGSFWQAYALKETLVKMGYSVVFSKTVNKKNYTHVMSNTLFTAIKRFIKFRFIEGVRLIQKNMDFEKIQKKYFEISDDYRIKKMNINAVIVGSDTVWNLDSDFFMANMSVYFATGWKGYNKITYAVSAADTTIEKFQSINNIKTLIEEFHHLSVRDKKTASIVEKLTLSCPLIVCDPTMLLEKQEYEKFIKECPQNSYIFVYYFDEISTPLRAWLVDFAERKRLKIIVMEHHNEKKWCQTKRVNPENFLTLMRYANYVITDTFHGTIFSIIYNKKFISIDKGKNKVKEVLKRYGLETRLCSMDMIEGIIDSPIDYETVQKEIDCNRKVSIAYLEGALGENEV